MVNYLLRDGTTYYFPNDPSREPYWSATTLPQTYHTTETIVYPQIAHESLLKRELAENSKTKIREMAREKQKFSNNTKGFAKIQYFNKRIE